MSQHSAGQAVEWKDGGWWHGLGRYSQQISKRFDDLLDDAAARGIYVQMCLDSFNGWNKAVYSNWNDNPYNVAQGGMLSKPIEYLTNAEARAYARKRFRYIVARWSYSTAVLCWEFWNEADIIGAGDPGDTYHDHRAEGEAWHREMGAWIRSIDPYEHLRTTSFSNDPDPLRFPEIWSLPEMDLVESHRYNDDLPLQQIRLVRQMKDYPKPCILGEYGLASAPSSVSASPRPLYLPFGIESAGTDPTRTELSPTPEFSDPDGQSLHDMIWAAAVEESAAASWWWDNWIAPQNLWHVFTPLAVYLQGEDWAPLGLGPNFASVVSGHSVRVYGVQSDAHAYLWAWDAARGDVSGLVLELPGMRPGPRRVEYWNTYSGTVAREETVEVPGDGAAGRLRLAFPPFRRDMAVKVVPVGVPSSRLDIY